MTALWLDEVHHGIAAAESEEAIQFLNLHARTLGTTINETVQKIGS